MSNTKKRLSVTLDTKELEEAVKQTGASNKRQAIEHAVRELLQTRKRKALADRIGTGVFGTSEAELRQRRHRKHGRTK
jgi:Arc/MetJ family transcription regulator